ncbi:MAG: hypothetical protein Q8O30_01340, partial [Candidatus Omnitrophota bacterium]|nr:hypothetical protein [Candidatus Omnitrophota bacterium]
MIGEGFSWKEFLEKCRVKRKKGSNFIRKSDKHALFVGIITFLIIILLLKYVPCFLPVPCPVPFTTYSIFVIILSLGFSVLWLIYRKPTSKLVIILRIGLPYLIIQGVPPLVAVMFEIGFFMIFFSYLILLPLAIAGLIFGLIYLILYWILKDFFRIDINLKILFAGFLLVLLLFPLWNFYIGRFIIYGLHNDAVDHFKKTYLNTDKIELINQTLGKGGWWTSVDSYYAVDLYEQLYGCKEGLCIYAEYRPEVGAVRVDLFNLPFFMLNKWTLNLRKDDYFTDFELISRDVAEDPPLFIVFNTEDVKPF